MHAACHQQQQGFLASSDQYAAGCTMHALLYGRMDDAIEIAAESCPA